MPRAHEIEREGERERGRERERERVVEREWNDRMDGLMLPSLFPHEAEVLPLSCSFLFYPACPAAFSLVKFSMDIVVKFRTFIEWRSSVLPAAAAV